MEHIGRAKLRRSTGFIDDIYCLTRGSPDTGYTCPRCLSHISSPIWAGLIRLDEHPAIHSA